MGLNQSIRYCAPIVLLFILLSCTNNKQSSHRINAYNLYSDCKNLNIRYIDSLVHARDSNRIEYLLHNLEESLTSANYKYPSDTDLYITEGENDTLINLNKRIIIIRDSLYKSFANKNNIPDSLKTLSKDSIR